MKWRKLNDTCARSDAGYHVNKLPDGRFSVFGPPDNSLIATTYTNVVILGHTDNAKSAQHLCEVHAQQVQEQKGNA